MQYMRFGELWFLKIYDALCKYRTSSQLTKGSKTLSAPMRAFYDHHPAAQDVVLWAINPSRPHQSDQLPHDRESDLAIQAAQANLSDSPRAETAAPVWKTG